MAAPTLAFGEPHVFGLPDGTHLYGREFELLPAGTMFAASVILHGLIGVPAEVGSDNVARVSQHAQLRIFGIRETDLQELSLHEADVIEAYRIRQLQDAQG